MVLISVQYKAAASSIIYHTNISFFSLPVFEQKQLGFVCGMVNFITFVTALPFPPLQLDDTVASVFIYSVQRDESNHQSVHILLSRTRNQLSASDTANFCCSETLGIVFTQTATYLFTPTAFYVTKMRQWKERNKVSHFPVFHESAEHFLIYSGWHHGTDGFIVWLVTCALAACSC